MLHSISEPASHLRELHSSRYEMVDNEPDIRGWKVIGPENQEIGKVNDLLFDENTQEVRYIIVDMNGKPLNLISRLILVPVGFADLLKEEKIVILRKISLNHLATIPTYERGAVTRQKEYQVRNIFTASGEGLHRNEEMLDDDVFYNHPHFENGNRIADRTMETGEGIRDNVENLKETVRKLEGEIERLKGRV